MNPIFIIGAARSGTKILRDLLYESDNCSRIPYDINFVWRYGNEKLNHDCLNPNLINKKNLTFIKKYLNKMHETKIKNEKPSLVFEKTVSNSLRPLFVHKCFPNSKIILLVRNGYAVTESAYRAWTLPNKTMYLLSKLKYFPLICYKYAFWYLLQQVRRKVTKIRPTWGPRYVGIDEDLRLKPLYEVCALQWCFSIETSFREINEIPKHQIKVINYEDLIKNTNCLESICEFCDVDPSKALIKWHKSIEKENNLKWKNNLSSIQLSKIKTIFDNLPDNLKYLHHAA